ncbi:hypothetical protein [Paraburkholderia sp. CNPSo 3274]|uniref:hypothetical protein n=1 Tax=Paraburkholderia sp. CNPSo 3274 TaxID=2940932 RepID=UPI0035CD244F
MAASGLVGDSDVWLIPGNSFVATLQTLSFTHIENLTYTSVMTTGTPAVTERRQAIGMAASAPVPSRIGDAAVITMQTRSSANFGTRRDSLIGDRKKWQRGQEPAKHPR